MKKTKKCQDGRQRGKERKEEGMEAMEERTDRSKKEIKIQKWRNGETDGQDGEKTKGKDRRN